MPKTIYLDPGHGGSDPGAVSGSRRESDDVLRLGLRVQALLKEQGYAVPMSRTADTAVTLATRTAQANFQKADLFISLHRNAFSNASANGVEVWVYTTPTAAETGAACAVLERIAATGIQSNRGVKCGNYHVLRESNMPAMLVELGFITNAEDNRLFDTHLEAYAKAIAQGAVAALGGAWVDKSTEAAPAPAYYRIQLGAFTSKANCEGYLQQIKALGLPAFMVAPGEAKVEGL